MRAIRTHRQPSRSGGKREGGRGRGRRGGGEGIDGFDYLGLVLLTPGGKQEGAGEVVMEERCQSRVRRRSNRYRYIRVHPSIIPCCCCSYPSSPAAAPPSSFQRGLFPRRRRCRRGHRLRAHPPQDALSSNSYIRPPFQIFSWQRSRQRAS
jgi:hypothetical protein